MAGHRIPVDRIVGRSFRDGGRLFGGPMDGKMYRHTPSPIVCFRNPGPLPRPDDPPPTLTVRPLTYVWSDFLGGYLFKE